MTLQERIALERKEELELQSNQLRSDMEALVEVWRQHIRDTFYPQNPSKIRNVDVRSAIYCDDPEDFQKRKVIEFRLEDFCTLKVGEDRDLDFDISTTGYFTHDVKDLPTLENACAMFNLAMALISKARDGSLVQYILKTYREVVENDPYKEMKAKLQDLYSKQAEISRQIQAEEKLAREQDIASKRVVGTVLYKDYSYRGATGRHIILAVVTQVTPTKIRLDPFDFWEETDDEGKVTKTAIEKGLEYIQKNKKVLIEGKYGSFEKNGSLGGYEILKLTK